MPPSGNYATAADAGLAAVAAKTGFGSSAKLCPPDCAGQPQVFGNADPTSGLDAAYVLFALQGSGNGTVCYAYVFYDSAGWHYTVPVVCPQQAGYNPVLGGSDHVNVSGGCANVHQGPFLGSKVVGCLGNGTVVQIGTTFPTYADGHIWWGISQGFMAHDFLITA
jgi:hypothetical protein